jgi:hypothetical protein
MTEMIMDVILNNEVNNNLIIMALGNPARFSMDIITTRLRTSCDMKITNIRCVQPSLNKITYNRDMIGKDDRYVFGEKSAINFFQRMRSAAPKVLKPKEEEILSVLGDSKATRLPNDHKVALSHILTSLNT